MLITGIKRSVKCGFGLMVVTFFSFLIACNKQDEWLDVKRFSMDVVPTTLDDFQAVLRDNNKVNGSYLSTGLISADNVFLDDADVNGLREVLRNTYLWEADIYETSSASEWITPYQTVELANIVLDGLGKISVTPGNEQQYNTIKSEALFFRTLSYYNLSQLFCKPYDPQTATTDKGIVLRNTSDITVRSVRSTVQQTYDQMIADLTTAMGLLPATPRFLSHPSSRAAEALLAKIYLSMENYSLAGKHADHVLQQYNSLLDFNSIDASLANPFPNFVKGLHAEIIFYAATTGYSIVWANGSGQTDPGLYAMYSDMDLRKTVLFTRDAQGEIHFKGTYTGETYNFAGLATNELYLIRAECAARLNQPAEAMADINALLHKRYITGSFTDLTVTSAEDALRLVLEERRKELPYTGQLRWEDLRRLNKDPRFAVTINRTVSGNTYTLEPNSKRYVYPIPSQELELSGLEQNER